MLGLRFFACEGCGTVYAGPDEPAACDECDATGLVELTGALRHEPYFVPD